jgi:Rieske 2Fe-2S family protein
VDSKLFDQELQLFFREHWVWVGRAEQVPVAGDYFLREVAGDSLIIVRGEDGEVRALFNVCRHRGTRICVEVSGNAGVHLRCPYHGWNYRLDGSLQAAPHMPPSFRHADYPLHSVQTAIWDGHIFVNMGRERTAIREHLGDLVSKFAAWRMQDLRLYKRIGYEVKANWKLIISNYSECLHCPLLHPALNRLTDYLGADNEPASATYFGGAMGFIDGAETMSTDGRRRRDYLPGLNGEQRRHVYYYAILPNLLLSLHPDYMMLHSLWPTAVDHTRVVCEWYFHPHELAKLDFHGDDAVELWDVTNREDWRVVELSQLGIQSGGYRPGPYSTREELLHAFDQIVRKKHWRARKAAHARD